MADPLQHLGVKNSLSELRLSLQLINLTHNMFKQQTLLLAGFSLQRCLHLLLWQQRVPLRYGAARVR